MCSIGIRDALCFKSGASGILSQWIGQLGRSRVGVSPGSTTLLVAPILHRCVDDIALQSLSFMKLQTRFRSGSSKPSPSG